MALPPRPVRPLPGKPALDSESGLTTSLVTRIVIVATIVLGQLYALTVALEASLLDHDAQAWLLAAFSIVSFVVALVLIRVEAPRRRGRLRGRAHRVSDSYVPTQVTEMAQRRSPDPPR